MSQALYHFFKPTCAVRADGDDAFSFFQSQATQDLRLANKHTGVYSLWLNQKGKVVGDSSVFCPSKQNLLIFSIATPVTTLVEHWQKFIISDDVELHNESGHWFGLACNAQAKAALDAGLINSNPLNWSPGLRDKSAWFDCFFNDESIRSALDAILLNAGAICLEGIKMEQLRINSGRPRIPFDVGIRDLPAEGGLVEDAISFNKGCFLGQEVVARMHHSGRPRRGLFFAQGDGCLPPVDSPVVTTHSAKLVGELRSGLQATQSNWIGLALCVLNKTANVSRFQIQGREIQLQPIN
jgi:folate-binding protein YgfZ